MAIPRPRLVPVLVAATLGASVLLAGGVAQAQPAEESPIGGTGAHPHHVQTGNGDCVAIDRLIFEPGARGLHRGALEGAPGHGTCP